MELRNTSFVRRLTVCLALMLVLSAACKADDVGRHDGQRAFKGWELYSWQDGDEWKFSLLPGTNRLKFCSEVRNPKAVLDLVQAEGALNRLAEVEHVFLWAPEADNIQGRCGIARPPFDMIERLRRSCRRGALNCDWAAPPDPPLKN